MSAKGYGTKGAVMTTWFITGASRGLGAEIARTAVGKGDNVVIAVRNPDRSSWCPPSMAGAPT